MPGLIDLHSHLLPGIDDGCRSIEESVECIDRLILAGYVGTICTPHIWGPGYPDNTPANIARWTADLRRELDLRKLDYRLWPGGELRIFEGVVEWMQEHGVPTLAGSRCVLFDFWGDRWPQWAQPAIRWLIDHHYQPVLAHPERMRLAHDSDDFIRELQRAGVWLQGNFASITGHEGDHARRIFRQYLAEGRYKFLAMDMHGPETLDPRFDGLATVATDFGDDLVFDLCDRKIRQLILQVDRKFSDL